MANGIDKAASLDVLCKKLGIKQEETIAFGDGYNDLSLIEDNDHTIYYDASANSWLNGQTITLSKGGTLTPIK